MAFKIMGRPRMFNSVEEFEERVQSYFEENEGGKISWTGLCLAVGASSRQSLERYKRGEHGQGFVDSVKKALLVIENYYEENEDGAKGIFIMKNFGWHDKQEVDVDMGQKKDTKWTVEVVEPGGNSNGKDD